MLPLIPTLACKNCNVLQDIALSFWLELKENAKWQAFVARVFLYVFCCVQAASARGGQVEALMTG